MILIAMTHEYTEPHYKDHETRGGLKLRAMFSTDRMGRNTLELVCPALRGMDADMVEGFLEITKDRINETIRDLRAESPDGRIDCRLIDPKPGYKPDRITLKGDNTYLLHIANKHGDLHMAKEPNYQAPMAFKTIADNEVVRDAESSDPKRDVRFAIQLKQAYRAKGIEELTSMINASGKAHGVTIDELRPYDPKIGALYITGPLEHTAAIATQFGSRCATNIKTLMESRSPA